MIRPPVLIVTDPSFSLLYGVSRAALRQVYLSVKFFRPVIQVQVSVNAGPEIIITAVDEVSRIPNAVIFQNLFINAAGRYKDENPDIPVIILEGRNLANNNYSRDFIAVNTDVEADYYRAGICAAYLSGGDGRILVYYDEIPNNALREAFKAGLDLRGFTGNPVYLEAGADYTAWQEIACAVIIGPAARFFEANRKIPVILFSWIDPEMTPGNVRIIFDDSPWALAAGALEMAGNVPENREKLTLPSELVIPRGRQNEGFFFMEKLGGRGVSIGKNTGNL